jgi:hypothetical protein
MSTVNASNTSNPYAYLQYPQQQAPSPTGSTQSGPLDALLGALGQGTSASAPAGAATTSGSSSPQFGPQTMQTLFAMQADASNSQSLVSELGASTSAGNQGPELQSQELSSANGAASSQTTTNPDGSSTTTITYANGSTAIQAVTAPSENPSSSASSVSTAGGANVANNNLLEQLIQIQSRLLNPTTTQSIVTV